MTASETFTNEIPFCNPDAEPFIEKYRGDGRKWIISNENNREFNTTMKESYQHMKEAKYRTIGDRRAALLQQFHDEAVEEINHEKEIPPSIEEYCTEYNSSFHASDFQPDDLAYLKDPERFTKYPLYKSPAITFWSSQIEKKHQGMGYLPGYTLTYDQKNPFKRNSNFTTPVIHKLDNDHINI